MERQNLANLKQDLMQAEEAQREAQEHVRRAQQALQTHKREGQEFVIQIQRQEEKTTQLRDELEEATPQTGVLDKYREELQTAEAEETILGNQFQEMVIEKSRLNREQRALKDQLNEIDSGLESAEKEVKEAATREEKFEKRRYTALLANNVAIQAVEDAQTRLQQQKNSRDGVHEEVLSVTAQASAHCARVPLDRGKTTADFENSYAILQENIEKSKKM